MATLYTAVIFAAIIGITFAFEKSLVVTTTEGKVEGNLSPTGLYYEFLGIRYGVPVKFRAPAPPPTYSGIYKADHQAVLCPQFTTYDPLAAPSDNEDCLVLNIFTPAFINSTCPVMVFLHGGDFGVGSCSSIFYGPQFLISHGVIVVTINYRLNVYGFLNLGTKDAPGNAGLKDIRAALRWIQNNIRNFQGDPDNVTVFGQGSGGVAAIYLTMSDSTKGLFRRIISESGTPFSPRSFDHFPLTTASNIAKCLSLKTKDPKALFKLYSETPIAKVEEAIQTQLNAKSVFLPSVEKVFKDEEPFLTDTPYNILTNKPSCFHPVPTVIGINTVEGLSSILDYETVTNQMNRIENEDFSTLDQRNFIVPPEEKEDFRQLLKDTFFTDISSDESLVGGIINMNTDFCYVGPLALFAELYGNNTDLYQYIFSYVGNRNLGRLLTNSSLPATSHTDELFYVFELERLPLVMDENDARIVTFMTQLWTNFAKYGTPTPDTTNGEWLPFPHHLAIDLEPQYVAPLTPERAQFWRALFLKYGADVCGK
ncbi:juvenile hormone esterase-like [Colias croceus]|uniref:juvenile hormone esterase-like n=1 Tax=Colias crocea TaxID=72248 RepID=UPI001E27AD7E|nr:juvenile hormone esterase-like [Colias croceus]